MKLLKNEEDNNLYLSKSQWTRVLIAVSFITLITYSIAMIFSLSGNDYFILNYQNSQMDKIESFMSERKIMPLVNWLFSTLEYAIIMFFVLNKRPRIWYIVAFYAIAMIFSATIPSLPTYFYTLYTIFFEITIPILDQYISKRQISMKKYFSFNIVRYVIAKLIALALQIMIYTIKAGQFSLTNHIMNLSATFIYAIEYDIALSVLLLTTALYIDRGKGGNKIWATYQPHSGSSQISTTQSQKSYLKKQLTKKQKNKIRWLYIKFYFIQLFGFLLLMALPFLLGKVLEFLLMYLSFAIVRYILGFKYSLHYKKETVCITVGVVVFGVLSLVVPFFYANVIMAIALGSGLAILLHLSYKYKGFVLFNRVSKPDKFALLYTFFDGDITEHNVKKICCYKGLTLVETQYIWDFVQGNKISYLAWKYNYSQRMFIYKLDAAIQKLMM